MRSIKSTIRRKLFYHKPKYKERKMPIKEIQEVKDANNKLICKIEAETGILQNIYKKQEIKVRLEVGQSIQLARGGCITLVKRIDKTEYDIKSYKKSA